jgi:hypothetical protein
LDTHACHGEFLYIWLLADKAILYLSQGIIGQDGLPFLHINLRAALTADNEAL